MKTFLRTTLLIVFLLLTFGVSAQSHFGIRQGIAATTLSATGDLPDNNNVTWSYSAGAFYNLSMGKGFAFQPELNYIRKGRSGETTELNSSSPVDYMTHYLQVPLLFQYRDAKSAEKNGSSFYVNAGPYAAFSLGDQIHPSGIILPNGNKNTDWGAILGVGYQMPIFKQQIIFDLRYEIGMTKLENQPNDYHTKALCLSVGIVF